MEKMKTIEYIKSYKQIFIGSILVAMLTLLPAPISQAVDGTDIVLDLDSMYLGDVYLPDMLPVVRTKKTPWKEFIASGNNASRRVADRLHQQTEFDFGEGLESRMSNGWISGIAFQDLGFEVEVMEVKSVQASSIRHAATAALHIHLARKGRVQPFHGEISWGLTPKSTYQDIIDHLGDPSQWGVSASRQRHPAFYAHDQVAEDLGRRVTSDEDALEAFEVEHSTTRPFVSNLFYERILGNLNLTFHFSSGGQLQSIEIVPQI